ncbi:MAG: hypothetical protein ABS939_02420 [Psychrobacillus sp.]
MLATITLVLTILISVGLGYVMGAVGGITIYHEGKPVPKEKGEPQYNEDYVAELPPEIRQYYEQNNGMNKF